MPKISVVVPAYNAEKTIKLTLSDLIAQTYRDYEIVLVDDGSTDSTASICDSYREQYDNICVLHQANGGLSNARNNGTKAARGEYVTYVDSDDRVEKYFLEHLANALEETGADIAYGRVNRAREWFEPTGSTGSGSPAIEVFDRKQTISEMLTGKKIWVGAYCRLIPKEWMVEEPFLEGKIYEDLSNTYRVNLKTEKTVFVDENLYHYLMHAGSITSRKKPSAKQCRDYYEAIKLCTRGCLKAFPDLQEDAAVLVARDFMSLYLHIRRCDQKDSVLEKIEDKIVRWMKKYWRRAFLNEKAPQNVRLRIMLFVISPWLYEKLYYIGIRFTGKRLG